MASNSANAYAFSYRTTASTGVAVDVMLQITTNGMPNADGSLTVTDIRGERNGLAVFGLSAIDGLGGNDNLFLPPDKARDTADSLGYALFSSVGFAIEASEPVPGDRPTPACYCAGTRIRTARGNVAVEDLAQGDLVMTSDGSLQPVLWIGRHSYSGRFLAARDWLYPVRIKAGALADGVPSRDLLVSPTYAIFLAGVLVSASDLVNGSTIVVDRGLARVDYIHLELPAHALIWAEDTATETALDDQCHVASAPAAFCAPRVTHGFELEVIRRRIASRTADMAGSL